MSITRTVGSLFDQEPARWGLRGDPYLWQEMRAHFEQTPLPASEDELARLIEAAFHSLTGYPLSHPDHISLERMAHGGMSSGSVSPEFWRETAIPWIRTRFSDI